MNPPPLHTHARVHTHVDSAARGERCKLLRHAMRQVQSRARVSGDVGVVVEALPDGWLEQQQHAMLRDMHNLGF